MFTQNSEEKMKMLPSKNNNTNTNTMGNLYSHTIVSHDTAVAEIKRRFDRYGCKKLNELLQRQSAVVAGSFPLQCLCGELWFNSDIDIFVTTENATPIIEYLKEIGRDFTDEFERDETRYDYSKFVNIHRFHITWRLDSDDADLQAVYADHDDVVPYVDYTDRNVKIMSIQVIELYDSPDAVIDCVKAFDINVCKVWYDGASYHTLVDIDDIKHRKALYQPDSHITDYLAESRRKTRIAKYRDRGFSVEELPHNDVSKMVKSAAKRA